MSEALTPETLFRLFCLAAVRDGPATTADKHLLADLQALLDLPIEVSEAAWRGTPGPAEGPSRDLDKTEAYREACRVAWSGGALPDTSRALLNGLAQFLRLDPSEAQSILSETPLASAPKAAAAPSEPGLARPAAGLELDFTDSAEEALLAAAEAGDAAAVSRALAAGTPVDCFDLRGRRPLHLAARGGHVGATRTLLRAEADLSLASWDRGLTPLHAAAEADQPDTLRALLEAGADLRARDLRGATPLHRAAAAGAAECVRELSIQGAGIDRVDETGATPIALAKDGGHFEASVHLEARDAPEWRGEEGLRRAARAEDPVALLALARAADQPDETRRTLLERAHAAGYAPATFVLALHHLAASPPDPQEARQLWVQASQYHHHPGSLRRLGRLYLTGDGVPPDRDRARSFFRNAARRGDLEAMRLLGGLLTAAGTPDADRAAGRRWLRHAAELGDRAAMVALGELLAETGGGPGDPRAAAGWFRKAAELGEVRAMLSLATALERGRGVTADRDEARRWFRAAADRGDPEGRAGLSRLGSG